MKVLIFFLLFFINLYANTSARADLDNNFFLNPYQSPNDGICEPSCRAVDTTKYKTKMIDFDSKSGLTSCEVFYAFAVDQEQKNRKLSVMANTLDPDCTNQQESIKPNYADNSLASKTNNNYSSYADIADFDSSKTTMSKFISGLATLDQDMINLQDTTVTGTLVKSNPNAVYSPDSADASEPNLLLNQIDSLNTQNLTYFVDLFYYLDQSYEYIVSYLVVFLSLFFMVLYIAKLGLKKLEKKTLSHEEPFTMRLSIIVIAFLIFFLPIKVDNNYSNSMFQLIAKYFIFESSSMADKANKVALKQFVKYSYNTTGASGIEEEANLKALMKKEEQAINNYENALKICEEKFPELTTYQITDMEKINELEQFLRPNDNTTIQGCRAIEKRQKVAYTQKTQYEYHLERIKSAYQNSEITNRLDKVAELLNRRSDEMGWYSSILVPTVKVLTELSFISSNENPPLNEEVKAKIRKAQINPTDESNNWLEDLLSNSTQYAQDLLGESFAKIIYLMFPGSGDIFSLSMNLGSGLSSLISQIPVIGTATGILGTMATPFLSLALTAYIVTYILKFLPLVTGIIATILAIILYLYELIIYVLISPFVVAFALSTGQSRKIIDFLITGITIFLRPVLIVVSVYLAMFFYSFVHDNIIVFSLEQFALLQNSTSGFVITLLSYIVKELISIFAIFLSIYIVWKTIVSGADYVFKMIGLDNLSNTTQLADDLSNQYKSRYTFNA
jgi:hypothetical protein